MQAVSGEAAFFVPCAQVWGSSGEGAQRAEYTRRLGPKQATWAELKRLVIKELANGTGMVRSTDIELEGRQVKVYRNLNNGLWSVMLGERVVAHLATVNLLNVTFRVRPAGRLRVLAEQRRNVHAYALGTFTAAETPAQALVSYNPYRAAHFYLDADQSPITHALHLRLTDGKAYATPGALLAA